MTVDEVLKDLASLGSRRSSTTVGLEYFGIKDQKSFGISAEPLKKYAREVKKKAPDRHALALDLWKTGVYEARAIAFIIDDPKKVTEKQMEAWIKGFDNWATVDGTCSYLFCRTPLAYEKAFEWAEREPEFEKRASFSLMAYLAVHDKKAEDAKLAAFLPVIEKHAYDGRNFVKKAVNWALRQIGKRNMTLNGLAIKSAERIKMQNTSPARWIAADALRELRSPLTLERLARKELRRVS